MEGGHYASSVKFTRMQARTEGSMSSKSSSASCRSLLIASLSRVYTDGCFEPSIGISPVHSLENGSAKGLGQKSATTGPSRWYAPLIFEGHPLRLGQSVTKLSCLIGKGFQRLPYEIVQRPFRLHWKLCSLLKTD